MTYIELTTFGNPIAPYNEIIIDSDNNLLLEVIYNTGRFVIDEQEAQLFIYHNGVQVIFQTVGSIYHNVSYLVQAVDWYCKHHLDTNDVKISFYAGHS